MNGILFLKTQALDKLKYFYTKEIGCDIWLEQAECTILRHGNFLFGFCQRDSVDSQAMLTFFYPSRAEVDRFYDKFKSIATTTPAYNEKYNIYQFFAKDPEGRMLEFQYFEHPISTYLSGDQLLMTRRSYRDYADTKVTDETITKIIDLARFAPTSYNCQGNYFKVIRDADTIKWLSEFHEDATAPIGKAGTAVAIVSDSSITTLPIQDGCLVTHQFMLAAWWSGLGTCWIGNMNHNDVKDRLDIPHDHYLVTVTPLGYPKEAKLSVPSRKDVREFMR